MAHPGHWPKSPNTRTVTLMSPAAIAPWNPDTRKVATPPGAGGQNVSVATIAPSEAPIADHATTSERMPLGRWLRTTPGLVRLFSVVAVVGIVAVGVLGTSVLTTRRDAVESVATSSGQQLATASELYASLAAADATASSALLRTGSERPEVRDRYRADLDRAELLLTELSERADISPTTQDAIRVIETQLSAYAERVAAARTNRRFGQPVGAAYMRVASAQMRDEILPAATTVWRDAAVRLQDDYETGTSSSWPIVFGAAGGVVALGLVALSVFLMLRTRRLLNPGVLVATVLLLAAVGASLVLVAHRARRADAGPGGRFRSSADALGRVLPGVAGAGRRQPRPRRAGHG